MGLQKPKSNKKKQNQNEYQMAKPCLAFWCNTSSSHPTSIPPHWQFYVM
jgi:hypothetical protein